MKEQEVKEHWTAAKFVRLNGSVLDFSGLYEVSDLGRVRSIRFGKTKMMSQCTLECKDGSIYYNVTLQLNKKQYTLSVHRLILSSFKGSKYEQGQVVDHIDPRTESYCNNCLDNLRWFTIKQNSNTKHCRKKHSKTMKGKLINRKDLSKKVKVTDLKTREITEYPSGREAGRALGINPTLVSVKIIRHNGYYKKLGLHFAYID